MIDMLAVVMGATRLGIILSVAWYVVRCYFGSYHFDWAKGRRHRAFYRKTGLTHPGVFTPSKYTTD